MTAAIKESRLLELFGHGHEELAEQEGAEGTRDEWKNHGCICIDEPEEIEDDIHRNHDDVLRYHHRCEQYIEQSFTEWKAQSRKCIGGHRTGKELAKGYAQRNDDAVEKESAYGNGVDNIPVVDQREPLRNEVIGVGEHLAHLFEGCSKSPYEGENHDHGTAYEYDVENSVLHIS